MKSKGLTRRKFIATVSAGSVAAVASNAIPIIGNRAGNADNLAILGGTPVRSKDRPWPKWPYVDLNMVNSLLATTNSGKWCRTSGGFESGSTKGPVDAFEAEYAKLYGVKRCVAVNTGTSALNCAVEALDIGAGDEVITSPYSDIGTIDSIMVSRALPVMADLDPESYQLDPDEVEKRITENTRAIMPVHIMGVPCNMERIMAIAKKHNLLVIEDSCQAHFAEYQGKKLGTIGDLGCFSFQVSKAIACGEGGAVVGNDEERMAMVYAIQNKGSRPGQGHIRIGPKYRMTEFEGAILMGQLPGILERFEIRNKNADYLSSRLKNFPGLVPQKQYEGTTKSGYYKYALSYHKEHFNNADRSKFLKAIQAEGIPLSAYVTMGFHRDNGWQSYLLNLKVYQKMYSPARLKKYRDEFDYPNCDKVCAEVVILEGPGHLLGTREDMDDIINAVMKVYENRDKLNSI
jgi:perosamine synthetase